MKPRPTTKRCMKRSRLPAPAAPPPSSRAVTPGEQKVGLIASPHEPPPHQETMYKAAGAAGPRRRVIITKPKRDAPTPAVLFVGGIGCYSMDYPFDRETP